MKRISLILVLLVTTALFAQEAAQNVINGRQGIVQTSRAKAPGLKSATLRRVADNLTISDSVAHGNLEVFLIEGDDLADTSKVLTLDEAMSMKSGVIVKETKQVNELTVENNLSEKQVFIMAGDIVKGGQQDRTLASDLPLPAKSGSLPVASFCVEQGRWTKRGNESADSFATSKNSIATKEGKLAVRKAENQSEVWKSVAKAQESLSRNIGKDVKPAASASSLQLTLEDKDLKAKLKAFQETLLPLVEAHPRSLGFVYAINGEINSAEIFAGHDLFRRVWPKLVDGMATEAVALTDGAKAKTPPSADAVRDFIAQAEKVAAFEKPLSGSLQHVSAESDDSCLFETVDSKKGGQWLRRHIIKK